MLFYPALRDLGRRGLEFVLALTIGLLVFLLIDTLQEGARDRGRGGVGLSGATALVWLAALLTLLALLVVGRRDGGAPEAIGARFL